MENILNIFDKSNHKDFSINFINLIKLLIDFSANNKNFQNIFKEKFIERILLALIEHIQYFDATYNASIKNCFYTFINFANFPYEEKLFKVLNECYNEKQITEIIMKYFKLAISDISINQNDKKIKEFMNDIKELYHGTNKIKYDFIEKYSTKINDYENGNVNNEIQKIKIKQNSPIYMDVYSKK